MYSIDYTKRFDKDWLMTWEQRTGQSVKDWIAEQEKSAFYAKQVDEEMDKLWESGQFDQKKLDELRGQHLRTPYK